MKYTKQQKEIISLLKVGDTPEKITNPYSEESVVLDPFGVALYDFIKGCELFRDYENMHAALEIFVDKYPEEYFILLD